MIDRKVRQTLITLLQRILDGDATLDSLRSHPIETNDETVENFHAHFIECAARLPLSGRDDVSRPSPQTLAEMKRAILFLRTDLAHAPPAAGWADRIIFACMIVFLAGVVAEMLVVDRLIAPVAHAVRTITLTVGGIFIGSLLVAYLIALIVAAVHIFRVRVLGHETSDLDPDDTWPFESPEQMRQAEALTPTETAPP